jgi:peptide/nickel transport system substrate-binding protein
MRTGKATAIAACGLLAILAFALGARAAGPASPYGSGIGSSAFSSGGFKSPLTEPLSCATRGGTLEVLDENDFESLDPGESYYSVDYGVVLATQRPLYSIAPDATTPSPDLAQGAPEVSADHKTITVHLKEGVHFSPPVNREVTSEDVAYALERGANPNVDNPYFPLYFGSIVGASGAHGGPIRGIETPSAHEIVLHLSKPDAAPVEDALALPLSAPVPKDYAAPFDRHRPSDYGAYEIATGPYMLRNDSRGKVLGVGYRPGHSATLVRNPNWNPATDSRPACLDEIAIQIGGFSRVLGYQVLRGSGIVLGEPPTLATLREASSEYREQLEISPGAGDHYIGVNNKVGPFKNVDLRKALWAALDRTALDRVRGGALTTTVASHFLYPGIPGFEQAGGIQGPKLDFDEHPNGDYKVAAKYMRLAGYRSGRYTGHRTIKVVGARGAPQEEDAEIVNATLRKLGFHTKLLLPEVQTMYFRYCNVPSKEITVCPNVGWIGDFADPQAVLDLTFNGRYIPPSGNVNWSQTNLPDVNRAIAQGEVLFEPEARAQAWAKIDEALVQHAAAIPFDWDKEANIEGKGVAGVGDLWNTGAWDFSWTSLQ